MTDQPPGLRFYPTEEELLGFYLRNKLENKRLKEMERYIPVVGVYSYDPEQLPREILHLLDLQMCLFSILFFSVVQLRNEFSVCRVYIKSGTLRSFDRRPSASIAMNYSESQRRNPEASSSANPQIADQRTSSHGSSSPGDDGSQPLAAGATFDWDMLEDIIYPEQF